MIMVIVISELHEGRTEEFLRACQELRPLVLAEKGCLKYEHTLEIPFPLGSDNAIDADRVTLVEMWESDDALRAHAQVLHGKAFAERVRPLRKSVSVSAFRSVFG